MKTTIQLPKKPITLVQTAQLFAAAINPEDQDGPQGILNSILFHAHSGAIQGRLPLTREPLSTEGIAVADYAEKLVFTTADIRKLAKIYDIEVGATEEHEKTSPITPAPGLESPAPAAPHEAVVVPPLGVTVVDGSTLNLTNELSTLQVAIVFDGLLFTAENWPKRLSDAKWLQPARLRAGVQGGLSALWCPLALAQAIHAHKKDAKEKAATLKKLNSLFKRKDLLAQHRDAWGRYFQLMSND